MRCDDALDAVQEALEGAATPLELSARLPREVQHHLETCHDCRQAVHELMALDRMLAAPVLPDMPPELPTRIMAALQGAPKLEVVPPPVPARHPVAWLAAAIVLLVAGLNMVDLSPGLSLWDSVVAWTQAGLDGLVALVQPFTDAAVAAWDWSGPVLLSQSGSVVVAAGILVVLALGNWKLARVQMS